MKSGKRAMGFPCAPRSESLSNKSAVKIQRPVWCWSVTETAPGESGAVKLNEWGVVKIKIRILAA
jgi:hypothetical protein